MSSGPLGLAQVEVWQSYESVTVCPEGLMDSKLYSVQAWVNFINHLVPERPIFKGSARSKKYKEYEKDKQVDLLLF